MAGKNKRIIKKKETTFERLATYRKRSKGLLRKAFELSVLCDIDVALIMYSPNGVLRHFSGNKKLERILQDYIQNLATNPETNPEKEEERPVISQDTIDKIILTADQADMVNQQGLEEPKREEIDEEIRQYQNKLVLLQDQAKKLYPNPGTSNSIQESMERKRYLEEVLYKIMERKNKLLSRFNIRSFTDISQPNTQGQQAAQLGAGFALPQTENGAVQQQLQNVPLVRIGDPSSSSSWILPQARTDSGMWVPPQGGEQVQMPGVPVFGMGYPSSSSSWIPLNTGEQTVHSQQIPMQQPQAGTEAGMWVPPQGGEQVQLHGVPFREMTWIDSEFLCSNQPQEQPMQRDTNPVLLDIDWYIQTEWGDFKF